MIKIYGIKNCDTMKKSLKWLDDHGIAYCFFDYKKQAPDTDILNLAIKQHGWDSVINRRGTTWRKLSDEIRNNMNTKSAIALAIDNPSVIKRPLLLYNKATQVELGFQPERYAALFTP
jgi:Spx/MgsR family transcriptional regulator